MNDKVMKFPITYSDRRRNQLGPLTIGCEISGRLVKFNKKSHNCKVGDLIYLEVFPEQDPDNPGKKTRRICELVLTREDLLKALEHITPH